MRTPAILPILVAIVALRLCRGGEEVVKTPAPSSFNASKITRDPFERIDAKYLAQKNSVVVVAEGSLDQLFQITALSVDRLSIAVINGKAFAEKEAFIVRTKEKEIRTTLLKIRDWGVELDCDGTSVKVLMKREKPALADEDKIEEP